MQFNLLMPATGQPNGAGLAQQLGFWILQQRGEWDDLAASIAEFNGGTLVFQQRSSLPNMPPWSVWRDFDDVYVNIAGTQTLAQWTGNLVGATSLFWKASANAHWYFLQAFQSAVQPVLDPLLTQIGIDDVKFHFFGHSLGGAIAAIAYLHYRGILDAEQLECLTCGQPRVATVGLPDSTETYARVLLQGDVIGQLPAADSSLLLSTLVPAVSVPQRWRHYGSGWDCLGLFGFGARPNAETASSATALASAPDQTYWHNSNIYWQRAILVPAVTATLQAQAPLFVPRINGVLSGTNTVPAPDIPPAGTATVRKITDANFGTSVATPPAGATRTPVVAVVPPGQALTPVNPADVWPDLFSSVPPTLPTFSGGDSVALWKVKIQYRFERWTWSEIFFCDSNLTVDQVLKFDASNVAPLLDFRPPNTVVEYIQAADVLNPRLGKTKYLQTVSGTAPASTNRPDVVATGALVTCQNAGLRSSERIIRGWRDDLVKMNAVGNIDPATLGAVQGLIDAYLAALNSAPNYGIGAIVPLKSNRPKNWYSPTLLTQIAPGRLQLTFTPADFTALALSATEPIISIGGPYDRNLLGIRGEFYVQSMTSPNITIAYTMPGGAATMADPSLNVRKINYSAVAFQAMTFKDWRTRQTRDPFDLVRGRGAKVQTRGG